MKFISSISTITLIALLFNCSDSPEIKNENSGIVQEQVSVTKPKDSTTVSLKTDIDGNGSIDTLYNFNNPADCGLYSSLAPTNSLVTADHDQEGLFIFENLGNINGKPGDEIGYVVKWTDMSNINTYHVVSLENNQLKEIFSFMINELVSLEEGETFENNLLIKLKEDKTILYKYFSDTATVETGTHTF